MSLEPKYPLVNLLVYIIIIISTYKRKGEHVFYMKEDV